jgi:hypothetical protein
MSGNVPGRQNWTRSLTAVLIVAVVAAVAGYLADGTAGGTERLYLRSTAGPVLFDHGAHSQAADSCAVCHHPITGPAQEVSCRECHLASQQGEATPVSCADCHDDSYTPEMMSHEEYLEVEEHSCLGCHSPRSLADSYHSNCSSCHLKTAPARFAQAGGEVRCGACHLR